MDRRDFEYRTVDITVHKGRPAIDPMLNEMAKDGWRPMTIIAPTEEYPSYSMVFARPLKENPYDPELEFSDWFRWNENHKEEGDPDL